jgi:hypothetical protein
MFPITAIGAVRLHALSLTFLSPQYDTMDTHSLTPLSVSGGAVMIPALCIGAG